jgi:hypothetical protein
MTTLTRREQFALALLPAMYAELCAAVRNKEHGWPFDWKEGISRDAATLADAAIAELDRTAQPETAADMDGWISWSEHEQPVGDHVIVDVRLRNGKIITFMARMLEWMPDNSPYDIVQYRVVQS